MKRTLTALALILASAPALAKAPQGEIRIGVVTTLTTPSGVMGRDTVDALNLALKHAGGAMAGRPVRFIVEDDAVNPQLGRQKAEKLVTQDNVDVVAGFVWSNVLLAARKPVLDAGKVLISTNAGPSDMAGRLCHPHVFSTRGQNDMVPMAAGEAMNRAGVKRAYLLAPNYAAGKDMVAGVQRTFKGEVAGSDFTRWGDDPQLDFSAELAKVKASKADAVFAFYPGRASPAFLKQFEQAGLAGVKLMSVYTVDGLSLPPLQGAKLMSALGTTTADFWSPDLDNPANKRFVADYKAATGRIPSNYAAAAYDLVPMLKAAIEANGGRTDAESLSKALRSTRFDSVRGKFNLGPNNFPIDDYYELEVVADAEGKWTLATKAKVLADAKDPFLAECKMGG